MMPKRKETSSLTDHEIAAIGERRWMPPVGSIVAVHLPNEIVRGHVAAYLDENTMIAALDMQPPLSKSHGYHFKSKVTLTRARLEPSGEKWAIPEE